ncbi:Hypothetical protein, putative [Bodo saltans]|uniref:Uncharacterized protein n=1 Tax=Bodo saltans TaxID=75058 RepID=A0A0S4JGE9_BODSA|nr:Hypothetical protein, putative [Bodo saltans]|eukprot:CUG90571.1 Hypothetical protein, putative [Bodo saltans]
MTGSHGGLAMDTLADMQGDIVQSFLNTSADGAALPNGTPEGSPQAASLNGDEHLPPGDGAVLDETNKPPSPDVEMILPEREVLMAPLDEFPVLQTMGNEIPQLRVHDCVPTVMELLYRTRTKAVMYDAIFVHLDEAEAAAAARQWKRCKEHCLEAVTKFQKFVLLLVFNAFVLYQAQDNSQQQALSLAQKISQHKSQKKSQVTYFRDFLFSTPKLYHRIHHVNLWEGNKQRTCPLAAADTYAFLGEAGVEFAERMGVVSLDGDHRWRSDVLMPNFS